MAEADAGIAARRPCFEAVDEQMAEVLAAKTGAERLEIAFGLLRSARCMLDSHLTATHPEWTAEQRSREIARRISHGSV